MSRRFAKGSMSELRATRYNPPLPIAARLVFFSVLASVCATGSPRASLGATIVLAALAPIEWKADFSGADARIDAWLRRT
jgi:hypothetical protein